METDNSRSKDVPLGPLLQEWKVEAPLPPRFREQVWRRIERAEGAAAGPVSLATLFNTWLTHFLPRPAFAASYVAVLLVVGASAGWTHARQESARVAGELSARYAQAVDPYQTAPQP